MIDRQHVRAFTGPRAEERAERCGHFLKALAGSSKSREYCVEHGIPLNKASTESGGNTAGGFAVPTDFDDAIIAVRESAGAYRAGADVRPARSGNQVRPRRVGGLTAYYTPEGTAITESALNFDALEMSLRKLAILARGSAELFEDSAPDLGEYIAAEVGYCFAQAEDDAGFNGDGTSTFSSMIGLAAALVGKKSAVAAAAGHNTFTAIDAVDIGNLVGGVLSTAIATGAAWYVSPQAYGSTFARLAAVGGGLITTLRPDGTIASANYLGFPIRFSSKLPDGTASLAGKAMMYFGCLKQSSVLVERRGLVIAMSADRALENEQILVRGVERIHAINHSLGDASTRGAVAALIGTS